MIIIYRGIVSLYIHGASHTLTHTRNGGVNLRFDERLHVCSESNGSAIAPYILTIYMYVCGYLRLAK